MNPTAEWSVDHREVRPVGAALWTSTERLVLTFTALGMIASVLTFVSYQWALRSELLAHEVYSATIVKSKAYYVVYAIQIALLFFAGGVAFLSTDWRMIERGYRLRFALFIGAVLLMTVRGYSASDLFSTKLADASGPFPFVMSVMVFIGAQRKNWVLLNRALALLAVLLCAIAVVEMAGLQQFSRLEGVAHLTGFLNALYWPASWIVLKSYPPGSLAGRFRFVPIAIYALGSLFTQTRLNFLMVFAVLAMYFYLQSKRRVPQGVSWALGLAAAIWVSLFVGVFLRDTQVFEHTEDVAAAFSGRLEEDTRTGQLVAFSENVATRELLFGRGALATWNWPGMSPEWSGSTDVGYLSLLFYGGVPLLLTYVAVHLKPCFSVLRRGAPGPQHTAACVVLLWAVRMFSSTFPGLSLDSYPVLFFVGACISRPVADPLARTVKRVRRL